MCRLYKIAVSPTLLLSYTFQFGLIRDGEKVCCGSRRFHSRELNNSCRVCISAQNTYFKPF